ncbi:MAG: hypothetical protein GY861_10295 [bacterium]|nr:hypothetical protein [bacterium]
MLSKGQQVRIRKDILAEHIYGVIEGEYGSGYMFTSHMCMLCNKLITIASSQTDNTVLDGISYRISEDTNNNCWTRDMFEKSIIELHNTVTGLPMRLALDIVAHKRTKNDTGQSS